MTSFTAYPQAVNGVNAVAKDADTDRIIIDARPAHRSDNVYRQERVQLLPPHWFPRMDTALPRVAPLTVPRLGPLSRCVCLLRWASSLMQSI